MDNKTLFVTGISGNSGKFFVERLIKENYKGKIKCLVRASSDTTFIDNSGLNIEKIIGDIKDTDLIESAMVGVDIIVQIYSIQYSPIIIDAAIKNNVKWAILIHTTGRYSKYKSASAEYIRIEEEIMKKRDKIGITILRPTMIYGSLQDRNMYKLINYLYTHKFFPLFGSGKNLMQPVHAKDLGNAYYDVMINYEKTMNKEYNLSGKYPIEYLKLIKTVSKILDRNNVIVKIPINISILAAKIYNTLFKKTLISVEQVLRMQEDKDFAHEEATKDFGYSPCSFQEGILEEIREYLSKKR